MKTKNMLLVVLITILLIACNQKDEKSPIEISENNTALSLATVTDSINVQNLRKPVVFISGCDEDSNKFYTKSAAHFTKKNYEVINGIFSLEEIINWLNKNYDGQPYEEIHIVSHSNSWRGMSLKNTKTGVRITDTSLKEAITSNKLPKMDTVLSNNSKIIFHSCGLGNNKELLRSLKEAFSGTVVPSLYASPLFNIFGGQFSDHYLAKVYYGYYPTANSPGKVDLSKEFARAYPNVQINWLNALYKKTEPFAGGVYTYKFNIPVDWKLSFNSAEEIPTFKTIDELIDYIVENEEIATELFALKIPVEKFRWKEYTRGNKLIIEGKVTVVCILEPIMSYENYMQYMALNLEDEKLYEKL